MDMIINGTRYKCIEYAKSHEPINQKNDGWERVEESMELDEDATYLVSWISSDGKFSNPIRAFWESEENAFFPIDCQFTFPLNVHRYMKIPKLCMGS